MFWGDLEGTGTLQCIVPTTSTHAIFKSPTLLGVPSKLKNVKILMSFFTDPSSPTSLLTFYYVKTTSGPKLPLGIFDQELEFFMFLGAYFLKNLSTLHWGQLPLVLYWDTWIMGLLYRVIIKEGH